MEFKDLGSEFEDWTHVVQDSVLRQSVVND